MTIRNDRSLLWWLPAVIPAAVAGIMPDTFLDSPGTTIPHEAAFVLRFWIIIVAFAYIAMKGVSRGSNYLVERFITGMQREFQPPPR